jgi:RHS repeat-associated protein
MSRPSRQIAHDRDHSGSRVSRQGYAGYESDGSLDSTGGRFWHVRHRVLDSTLGRWTRRDPAGYVDGMNLKSYTDGRCIIRTDASGLRSCRDSNCPIYPIFPIRRPWFPTDDLYVPLPPAPTPPDFVGPPEPPRWSLDPIRLTVGDLGAMATGMSSAPATGICAELWVRLEGCSASRSVVGSCGILEDGLPVDPCSLLVQTPTFINQACSSTRQDCDGCRWHTFVNDTYFFETTVSIRGVGCTITYNLRIRATVYGRIGDCLCRARE